MPGEASDDRKGGGMRDDIKLYRVFRLHPVKGPEEVTFGVGVDRSLWMPATFLDLKKEALDAMQRKHGEVVMLNEADGSAYVEARALVLDSPDPLEQEAMVAMIRDLTVRLRPVTSSGDDRARN